MKHECAVCDTEFESKSSRAKYCPDCRKLSKKQREELAAETVAVDPAPEYKSPDTLPPVEPVSVPDEVILPEGPKSDKRVCKSCGAEYTVKHKRGGCPLCALDRHFGTLRR
jgi:Zn finger protein HypA/HybF involved in hydrogenase expression